MELNYKCEYCTNSDRHVIMPCEHCPVFYHDDCLQKHYKDKLEFPSIPFYFCQYEYRCEKCKTLFTTTDNYTYKKFPIYPVFILTFLQILFSFLVGICLDFIAGKNGYFVHFEDYFSVYMVNGLILTSIILAIVYSIAIPEVFYKSIKDSEKFYLKFVMFLPIYIAFPLQYEFFYKLKKREENYQKHIIEIIIEAV